MQKFQKLIALREQYPSTTSAVHSLVTVASDLDENYVVPGWVDFDGVNRSPIVFNECLDETICWAVRESGEREATEVLAFIFAFLEKYFDACPGGISTRAKIEEHLPEKVFEHCVALRESQRAPDAARERSVA